MHTVQATERHIRIDPHRRRAQQLPFSAELEWLLNVAETVLGERSSAGAQLATIEFGPGPHGDPAQCEPGGRAYALGVGTRQVAYLRRWWTLESRHRPPLLAYYGRFRAAAVLVRSPGSHRRRPVLDSLAPIVRRISQDAGQTEIEDLSGAKGREEAAWIARDPEEATRLRRETRRSQDDQERARDADTRANASSRRLAGAMAWWSSTEEAEARLARVTDQLIIADQEVGAARESAAQLIPDAIARLLDTRRRLVAGLHGEAPLCLQAARLAALEARLCVFGSPGTKRALRALSVALARVADLEALCHEWLVDDDWRPLVRLVEAHGGGPGTSGPAYRELGQLKRRAEGIVREAHRAWADTAPQESESTVEVIQ